MLDFQAHLMKFKFPSTQIKLEAYDNESYVTLQSPVISVDEETGLRAVSKIYRDMSQKGRLKCLAYS